MRALLFNPISKNVLLTLLAMTVVLACILLFQNFGGPVSQHFDKSATNSHYQEAYGYDEATDNSALQSK